MQIHDIYLPDDYPPHFHDRYYSEQYLLAAYLLGAQGSVEIVLPNAFVSGDAELRGIVEQAWGGAPLRDIVPAGASFWFRTV